MTVTLASKPGLSSTTTLAIPKEWDATWFRSFISNQLKGADVRNAVGSNGITVTGNIASPYGTITFGPGPIVLSTAAGSVALTVNGVAGQQAVVINGVGNTSGLTVVNDIVTYRSAAPTTGVIYFGSSATDYLYYNGAYFQLVGGTLQIYSGALEFGTSATLAPGPHNYGSVSLSGSSGGYAGIQFTGALGAQGRTLMLSTTVAGLSGIYDSNVGTWDWYFNGSTGLVQPLVGTTTTAPAAGGAGALPATPKGYFNATIGTYAAKIPYY
jgi:hypothetical protein